MQTAISVPYRWDAAAFFVASNKVMACASHRGLRTLKNIRFDSESVV